MLVAWPPSELCSAFYLSLFAQASREGSRSCARLVQHCPSSFTPVGLFVSGLAGLVCFGSMLIHRRPFRGAGEHTASPPLEKVQPACISSSVDESDGTLSDRHVSEGSCASQDEAPPSLTGEQQQQHTLGVSMHAVDAQL